MRWDLELNDDVMYNEPAQPDNRRTLQTNLDLQYEDRILTVYPAKLAPWPLPYPFPMNREAGIQAYEQLVTPEENRARLKRGQTDGLAHEVLDFGVGPVIIVRVSNIEKMSACVAKYELTT